MISVIRIFMFTDLSPLSTSPESLYQKRTLGTLQPKDCKVIIIYS